MRLSWFWIDLRAETDHVANHCCEGDSTITLTIEPAPPKGTNALGRCASPNPRLMVVKFHRLSGDRAAVIFGRRDIFIHAARVEAEVGPQRDLTQS